MLFIRYSRACILFLLCGSFFHSYHTALFAQSVQLAWTPSKSPMLSHYGIYRTIHVDSNFVLLNTVGYPDTTYVDDTVQLDTHYYYVATAVDLFGNESGFSNMVDTTISLQVPVELCSFSVQSIDNDAVLEWSTRTESNNYGFEVQRGIRKTTFKKIGFVKGHGTTVVQKNYRYVDHDLLVGTYYYRLKQFDLSGEYEFTNAIQISIGMPNEFRLEQNYPNPFNPETTISYSLPVCSLVELTIYNTSGQIVYKLVDEFQHAGRYTVTWRGLDQSGKKVASGVYYYKISTENSAMFRRMLLVR